MPLINFARLSCGAKHFSKEAPVISEAKSWI